MNKFVFFYFLQILLCIQYFTATLFLKGSTSTVHRNAVLFLFFLNPYARIQTRTPKSVLPFPLPHLSSGEKNPLPV